MYFRKDDETAKQWVEKFNQYLSQMCESIVVFLFQFEHMWVSLKTVWWNVSVSVIFDDI